MKTYPNNLNDGQPWLHRILGIFIVFFIGDEDQEVLGGAVTAGWTATNAAHMSGPAKATTKLLGAPLTTAGHVTILHNKRHNGLILHFCHLKITVQGHEFQSKVHYDIY